MRQWIGFSAGDEKTNCSGLNSKRFVRVRKVNFKIKGGTQRKQERRGFFHSRILARFVLPSAPPAFAASSASYFLNAEHGVRQTSVMHLRR